MTDLHNNIRVVVLGDGGTGKSCITMRLLRSKWVDEYDPTIEDSYSTQRVVDGTNYHLDIIDTAGQEEYRDMLGTLFSADSKIDAYLLVYDLTSPTSLENLIYFDELIEKNLELGYGVGINPVKMVVANKCDLESQRMVSGAEGIAWAQDHGCGFMETSAKTMVNIEEVFESVIRQVVISRGMSNAKKARGSVGGLSTTGGGATGDPGPASEKARGSNPSGLRQAFSSANLRHRDRMPRAEQQAGNKTKSDSACCSIC